MSQIYHKWILISGSTSQERNRTADIQTPALLRDAVGKGNSALISEPALRSRSQELQSQCHLISLPPCFLPSSFYYYIIYTWPAFLLSTFCWVNNVHIVLAVFPSIDWVKCSKYPVIPSLAFLSLVNNFFLQLPGIKSCGCALACSLVLMCLFRWLRSCMFSSAHVSLQVGCEVLDSNLFVYS